MSWENMGSHYEKCACEPNGITIVHEMDDWNRSQYKASLNCDDCSKKYNLLEKMVTTNKGEILEKYFLFPKAIFLPKKPERLTLNKAPIIEFICNEFPYSSLRKIYEEIVGESNSKNITGKDSLGFIKFYKETCRTQKMTIIKTSLKKAIDLYNAFPSSYDITIQEYDKALKIWEDIWNKHAVKI